MTTIHFELSELLRLGTCLVCVSREGVVEEVSPCLKRLLGNSVVGATLAMIQCPAERPIIALSLRCADGLALPLRGAWLHRSDGSKVFVGLPVPGSDDELEALGLTQGDFLFDDPRTYFLVETDDADSANAEASRRIDDLKNQRDMLENARDEMHEARRAAMTKLQDVEVERRRADKALEDLETTQRELMQASRLAGMAEVATGVLHNVGNILNSVNVSVTVISDTMRRSKAARLKQVAELLQKNASNLGTFLTDDNKGRLIPSYLEKLANLLSKERIAVLEELSGLVANVDHIKQIVNMQQSYTGLSGVQECVVLSELVEDALKINLAGLDRHGVEVIRDFEELPPVLVDRHKVLQILVNLFANAKYALKQNGRGNKTIHVQVAAANNETAVIRVTDNGVGISEDNLTRIFAHRFTTKDDGHGWGLHSSALAAKELGGALRVSSDGPGRGAIFVLELPLGTKENNADRQGESRRVVRRSSLAEAESVAGPSARG